jgi:hypothetical protein
MPAGPVGARLVVHPMDPQFRRFQRSFRNVIVAWWGVNRLLTGLGESK